MKRGFGLVDAIFATAVLFLIGLFVLNLFPGSLLAIAMTRDRLQANNLCQGEMATARHTGFSDLSFGTTERTVVADGTKFRIKREVYPIDGRDDSLIRGVKVSVEWTIRGKTREAQLETYLSSVRR